MIRPFTRQGKPLYSIQYEQRLLNPTVIHAAPEPVGEWTMQPMTRPAQFHRLLLKLGEKTSTQRWRCLGVHAVQLLPLVSHVLTSPVDLCQEPNIHIGMDEPLPRRVILTATIHELGHAAEMLSLDNRNGGIDDVFAGGLFAGGLFAARTAHRDEHKTNNPPTHATSLIVRLQPIRPGGRVGLITYITLLLLSIIERKRLYCSTPNKKPPWYGDLLTGGQLRLNRIADHLLH